MFIAICKQLKLVNYSLIRRLHCSESIHSDIIHFIFIASRLFYHEKNWHDI